MQSIEAILRCNIFDDGDPTRVRAYDDVIYSTVSAQFIRHLPLKAVVPPSRMFVELPAIQRITKRSLQKPIELKRTFVASR